MEVARKVKPISYLKSHTAEILRTVVGGRCPVLISHRGEVKLVIQDIAHFEAMRESIALLKILATGEKSRRAGKFKPIGKAFADVRRRIDRAEG